MKTLGLNEQQLQKMKTHPGFIAALDQSGGSTPSALRLYGIKEGAWSNEDEMFSIVHQMRTAIKQANAAGIKNIVNQQFEAAQQIITAGLVPIIEPEVDIRCPEKDKAEELLKVAILDKLNKLRAAQLVMLKITLPDRDDLYANCVSHPNVVKVVALSGGYTREEANKRLRRNHGIVASFSRALVDGLSAQQSDAEFNAMLDASIQSIFEASNTKQAMTAAYEGSR